MAKRPPSDVRTFPNVSERLRSVAYTIVWAITSLSVSISVDSLTRTFPNVSERLRSVAYTIVWAITSLSVSISVNSLTH